MEPVIPSQKNRKESRQYDKYLYRLRHLVENCFLALKRWRGIATRYAKTLDVLLLRYTFVVLLFGLPSLLNSCRHYLDLLLKQFIHIWYELLCVHIYNTITFHPSASSRVICS